MRPPLQHFWYEAVSSFFFVPLAFLAGSAALYYITYVLESSLAPGLVFPGWFFDYAEIDTARTVLSAISAAMITIASLVVPITIVALQLASQQYSSSLVRTFMRNRIIQIALGIFIATFVFSLLTLTQLPPEAGGEPPRIPFLTAVFLTFVSVVILIVFIHRLARMILPYNIAANVAQDLRISSRQLFGRNWGKGVTGLEYPGNAGDLPAAFESEAYPVIAGHSGYLEEIDYRELLEIADRFNLIIRLEARPGDFLLKGDKLALAWPGNVIDNRLRQRVSRMLVIGTERTVEMDIDFPLEQMLEMASKSLSDVTNEVFTARICLDWLEDSFVYFLREPRRLHSYFYRGSRLRLIIKRFRASELMGDAFQIFWNSARNSPGFMPVIAVRLLRMISRLAGCTDDPEDRLVLQIYAEAINRTTSDGSHLEEHERRAIIEEYQAAVRILGGDQTAGD